MLFSTVTISRLTIQYISNKISPMKTSEGIIHFRYGILIFTAKIIANNIDKGKIKILISALFNL
ncbi:hypothetical protein RCZ01_17540 [Capnocytophaga felis]|uniref:Uncharacterized protein n=1 Tax=Capnocytophaga felis TaxID=2267611 RepID=A0A5M4BAW3_9FLAO|nr:hypothetical protein RCZ01_17540 [Capnocytophaga felis]GET48342.1 hypothetical protein RCZ02_11730 [Capnocytophaga felis]